MIIRRNERTAHFYLKDGTSYYEVPRLDGNGMRPVRVTDAFKVGAYRSVTNVLGILDKPGLDAWKQEQAILSSMTLPRQEGEDLQQYAERIVVDSEEQSRKARDEGTRLHGICADWMIKGELPAAEADQKLIAPFTDWIRFNVNPAAGLIASETAMICHQHAYAGRGDLAVRMNDGSAALIDIKTQDIKYTTKGVAQPVFYDEWALQLAAYSKCMFADGSYPPPFPWRLISLVIGRNKPGCYPREWTDPQHPLESTEHHYQAFLAACRVWTYLKGGTPGIDRKAA